MRNLSIAGIFILLLTAVILVFPGCAPKTAVFDFTNLTVSPSTSVTGDTVTFSVDVTNIGDGEGSSLLTFMLDGTVIGEQSITLKPNTSQNVNCNVTPTDSGRHNVQVGALFQSFTVLKAANIQVSGLNIKQNRVSPDADVVVEAVVSNSGEVPADYEVKFQLDSLDIESRTGTLSGGGKEALTVTLNSDQPGIHTVSAGKLECEFIVLKPAEFLVSELRISPSQIIAGLSATVMVDVTNTGEVRGEYIIPLKVNGREAESKTVMLEGGATDTVSFTVWKEAGGLYAIDVLNLNGNLTVQEGIPPVMHIGDQWIYRINDQGSIYTKTETIIGEEVINGKACYVVKITYSPKYLGVISETTKWWEKSTLSTLMEQFVMESSGVSVNATANYTTSYTGEYWPLKVGNQFTSSVSSQTVVEAGGQRQAVSHEETSVCNVEKIETIRVNAGEFRCFKLLVKPSKSPQNDQWYSDKAKAIVKYLTSDGSISQELLSYSVK